MIVKAYELEGIKVFMRMVTNDIFDIVYINGNKSQIIKNDHAMDYETTTEIFDILIDKVSKTDHNNEEMGGDLFTEDEFNKMLNDLEKDGKK